MKVNVFWLVNHIIPNKHDIDFIEWEDTEKPKIKICSGGDEYYQTHTELQSRQIDFMVIKDNIIEVILK